MPYTIWEWAEYNREYSRKLASGEIKRTTLADLAERERHWIKFKDPAPHIWEGAFVRLMIWYHSTRDIDKINLYLTGLYLAKEEADMAEDIDFIQLQIEAYETLRHYIAMDLLE